jgi:Tfp pilus assembly protein FimT
MKKNLAILTVLVMIAIVSCSNGVKEKREKARLDSIEKTDSLKIE